MFCHGLALPLALRAVFVVPLLLDVRSHLPMLTAHPMGGTTIVKSKLVGLFLGAWNDTDRVVASLHLREAARPLGGRRGVQRGGAPLAGVSP